MVPNGVPEIRTLADGTGPSSTLIVPLMVDCAVVISDEKLNRQQRNNKRNSSFILVVMWAKI